VVRFGFGSYVAVYGSNLQIAVRTAHVLTGMLVWMVAVVYALRVWRIEALQSAKGLEPRRRSTLRHRSATVFWFPARARRDGMRATLSAPVRDDFARGNGSRPTGRLSADGGLPRVDQAENCRHGLGRGAWVMRWGAPGLAPASALVRTLRNQPGGRGVECVQPVFGTGDRTPG